MSTPTQKIQQKVNAFVHSEYLIRRLIDDKEKAHYKYLLKDEFDRYYEVEYLDGELISYILVESSGSCGY
jgi:hypothetical protein